MLARTPIELWAAGGAVGSGGGRTDQIFDMERYSNVEANPYVFGSYAFNYAHGLPLPTMDYLDRREARFIAEQIERERVAAAVSVSGPMSVALMQPAQAGQVTLPQVSLTTLAIAALVLWVVFK